MAPAVARSLGAIATLVVATAQALRAGGRLFYIGAGTSGRLGILDASECPPTFGVSHDTVIGIIAGGDGAIRRAVEGAEDHREQGWKDLQAHGVAARDVVVGISASGRTPYVVGAVTAARANGIVTGCVVCNEASELAHAVDYPVEVVVGPELLTGSTRMKAGTAQKLVLNMITTAVMVQLGHVRGNEMIDMQPTNAKLRERGARMLMEALGIERPRALELLDRYGSVRRALDAAR